MSDRPHPPSDFDALAEAGVVPGDIQDEATAEQRRSANAAALADTGTIASGAFDAAELVGAAASGIADAASAVGDAAGAVLGGIGDLLSGL